MEDVFDLSGRGCGVMAIIHMALACEPKDQINLRTSTGHVFETHIASIELVKTDKGPSRVAIMLPTPVTKTDIPIVQITSLGMTILKVE